MLCNVGRTPPTRRLRALPESLTPAEGAAYLIVEEIAGEDITRTIYQPEDAQITVYYQGEQPWCLPDMAQINWPE